MLSDGRLHIHVLDAGVVMNQEMCLELIEDRFEDWAGNCEYLVQDFERRLRTEYSLDGIRKTGLQRAVNV